MWLKERTSLVSNTGKNKRRESNAVQPALQPISGPIVWIKTDSRTRYKMLELVSIPGWFNKLLQKSVFMASLPEA